MTKEEHKQCIMHDNRAKYKCDTMVADHTENIKLVFWEDKIDMVSTGRCYHVQNVTVRIFDDNKFLNTNESTVISEIDEIQNVKLDTPEMQDNLLVAQVVGVDIKKTTSCMICNEAIPTSCDEEFFTCKNCHMTTLTSFSKTKPDVNVVK